MSNDAGALAFAPSDSSGRQARAAIENRLRESFAHILEQCRRECNFDERLGETLTSPTGPTRRIAPEVFGHYFALVRAIDEGDLTPVRAALDRLLDTASLPQSSGILLRPFNRTGFSEQEEREFREQFLSESLTDEQVGHLGAEEAEAVCGRLRQALALLDMAAPRTFSEFRRTIAEIVPARGERSADGLVFDGSSSLERWGAILINMNQAKSDVELCEALAHESAHNTLFGTSPVNFHVTNSPEERYPSPLRLDPRPIEGIYHATFVLARMCFAMREMAACTGLPAEMRTEAGERAEHSRDLFWDGYSVLRDHARYTEEGRAIMDATRAYMESLGGR